MSGRVLHANEVVITSDLVRRLLAEQFPQWAASQLRRIVPEGTDNVVYRLGNEKIVRLPRIKSAAFALEREVALLAKFEGRLPIAIPKVLGVGIANKVYPYPWLICDFIGGTNPSGENILDQRLAAVDLGHFVCELHKIDSHNGFLSSRSKALATRDCEFRNSLAQLEDMFDRKKIIMVWEKALAAQQWDRPPVWIHADLYAGNILVKNGKITGIIDFGLSGLGDPAVDLMVAWTLLNSQSRDIFRSIVNSDNATWERARGWALSFAVIAYPYYRNTNLFLAECAKNILEQVLAD